MESRVKKVHPIGMGTFRIDLNDHKKTLEALLYSFENGQNYIDTSWLYEKGEVLKFLSEFFSHLNRQDIFITTKLERYIEKPQDVEEQLDRYLSLMKINTVDCLQLHTPFAAKIPLLYVINEMDKMVKKGKAGSIGISNNSVDELKEITDNFKISSFESVYNLECKIYERLGVLDFCKEKAIDFIAYQPLRRNRTASRNYPLLIELSEKYHRSQNQIILNWLINEKKLRTILKSTNQENIKSNLDSLNFEIEPEDMEKLNRFQSQEFNKIEIDWQNQGGTTIDQLPNQFE